MTMSKWLARTYRKVSGRKRSAPSLDAVAEGGRAAAAGDAARDRQEWESAIRHYALSLALIPENAPIRIQMGHALKEVGRWPEAEAAYRMACVAKPDDADLRLHLGAVLKLQGRRQASLEAYVEALEIDPDLTPARNELIAVGARDLLPSGQYGGSAAAAGLARISDLLDQNLEAIRDWVATSTYPTEAYHNFREGFPVSPPPPIASDVGFGVLVQAVGASATSLRVTLSSLLDQRDTAWKAIVRVSGDLLDHPVASYARQDPRIVFASEDEAAADAWPSALNTDFVLMTEAGCRLDREAVGWLRFAATRTGADVIYADHDHHAYDWRRGETFCAPALHPMPDVFDMETTPEPPLCVLISRSAQALISQVADVLRPAEQHRRLISAALRGGLRAAHLPRIISSRRIFDATAPVQEADAEAAGLGRASADAARILVIVPTRDQAGLLRVCLDSLKARASKPELVDVLVVDNRSVEHETLSLLAERASDCAIEVLSMDEPFNWARFNNLAAVGRPHDVLVFANNDLEFLTSGWDEVVRAGLSHDAVGVLGARLLYPDRKVQHAGMIMGGASGRPVHEGVGAGETCGGPLNRWRRRRQASAVTGALMAMKRSVFEKVGGFNERLAIAYNDIDLCFRVRATGLCVLYEPALEAVHHESKTRGRNDNSLRVSWDDGELGELYHQWGEALFMDPGKNLHWMSIGENVFDGYRDPTISQIVKSLDQSCESNCWAI